MVTYLQDLLQSQGIPCLLRNEYLGGAAGELPPIECWPELWVRDDEDLERARRLLAHALEPVEAAPAWRCAQCGERIEGQFTQCWHCGALRPSDSDS